MLAAAEAAAMMAAAEAAARDAADASNSAESHNDFPQSVMYGMDDDPYQQHHLDSMNGTSYNSFGGQSSLSVSSMDRSMDGAHMMGGGYMGVGVDSYASEVGNQSLDQSYNDMEATAINSMLQQMAVEQQYVQQQQEYDPIQQQYEEDTAQAQHEEYLNFQNQFASDNAAAPHADDAMASDALGAWPEEHFLTVANNGTFNLKRVNYDRIKF